MTISIPGLVCAIAMLVVGLLQWGVLKRAFANARVAQAAEWTPAIRQEREAMHRKVLNIVLGFDVLALPPLGYFIGQSVFGK